jgi:large subunit ribosomal protein L23
MAVSAKLYDLIKRPVVTEKTTSLSQFNQVEFIVQKTASKVEIKKAVEEIFGVKVASINTINQKGKQKVFRGRPGVRSDFKKAIVTLKEGEQLDVLTGAKN